MRIRGHRLWLRLQLAVRFACIALLAVAGAWACVAHCALLGSPHHVHAGHSHATDEMVVGADQPARSTPADVAHCPPGDALSALTVGVVLPLLLALLLVALPVPPLQSALVLIPVAVPPPRKPPRFSLSLSS